MKTLLAGLFFTLLLTSCDPNADKKVGNDDRFRGVASNNGSGGSGTGTGTGSTGSANGGAGTTDVPFDAGLSTLLVAGAAYGLKRVRRVKPKN